ncbi:FtsK/SpoIIIE domain-containing protein [Streptomyces sp. RGM 3693]|uniref:FtsK/SpoIIIE domain-containing protein n=1 Tax=Streptomyces sp. RGM 3693 TaxID=3413284 RepID=UPI003D29B19F
MQIRLTVLGPRSGHTTRACDVLVTAPAGTALATVAGSLAAAVAGTGADVGSTSSSAPVVLYAGAERLDPQRAALGEPPLIDGAVLSLQGPGPAPAHGLPHGSARLRVVSGPDAGGVHLLHGGQIRIGRSADADVPLDDPDVSRLHCAVTVEPDGAVYVADLRSTNGTAVDGTELHDLAVPLPPGALLRIGESALRLQSPPRTPDPALNATPDGEGHLRVAPGRVSPGATATGATTSGALYAHPGHPPTHAGAHGTRTAPADPYGTTTGTTGTTGNTTYPGTDASGNGPVAPGHEHATSAGATPPMAAPPTPAPESWPAAGSGRRDTPLRGVPVPGWGGPEEGGLFPPAAPATPRQEPTPDPATYGQGPHDPTAPGSTTPGAAVPGSERAPDAAPHAPTHATYGNGPGHPTADYEAPTVPAAVAGHGVAPTGGQTHGGQQSLVPADPVTRKAGRRGGIGAWARRLAGGRPVVEPHDPTPETAYGDGPAPTDEPSPTAAGTTPAPAGPAAHERWPDAAAVLLTALGPGPRLWERGPEHPDALTVRLGTAERDGGRTVTPVTVELRRAGALGLAGPRGRLVGLARSATAQLAALHSPGALEIALISADRAHAVEERVTDWSWLGWLPHVRPARGQDCRLLLAYDKEQAAARTAELVRRLDDGPLGPGWPSADRAEVASAAARHQGPYTLLIVDGDPGSSALRETTARLAAGGPAAGIHVLCLAETPAASPAFPLAATYEAARVASPAFGECGAVAVLSGDVATALRVVQPGSGPNGTVATVDAVSVAWAERFARALAPLREAETGAGPGGPTAPRAAVPLPDSARLLDELGLARATPASLMARWAAAQDTDRPSAAAVLGAGPHGPVVADLAADGAHLLVEGAAATGKTELLRSLAASLAAADRPDRLSLVLVDGAGTERGEGLRVCTELPHVTTHLAASDPVRMREFAQALSSELKRRAEILAGTPFSEWRTKHLPAPRIIAPRRSTESTSTPGTFTPNPATSSSARTSSTRTSSAPLASSSTANASTASASAAGASVAMPARHTPPTPPTPHASSGPFDSSSSSGSSGTSGSSNSSGLPATPGSPVPPDSSATYTPSIPPPTFTASNEAQEQITLRNRCRNKEDSSGAPADPADPSRTGTLRLRTRPDVPPQDPDHPNHHGHPGPSATLGDAPTHRMAGAAGTTGSGGSTGTPGLAGAAGTAASAASAASTASATPGRTASQAVAQSAVPPAAPMPRLFILVDDFDALVSPALGSTGRPAAGSVVRALEAVARDGAALGVHLIAATGHPDRTEGTATAERAALLIQLGGATGPSEPTPPGCEPVPPGRGRLHRAADGTSTPFQAGRVTGRIPRTSTLRPTVVPLEWQRMGDPPARRPLRELGNGPTDLALLASALQRAAQSSGAPAGPSLV